MADQKFEDYLQARPVSNDIGSSGKTIVQRTDGTIEQIDPLAYTNVKLDKGTFEGTASDLEDQISGAVSGFQGALLIADTPTADGSYTPIESGTYPNAGNLEYLPDTTDKSFDVKFIKSGVTWTKSTIDLGVDPVEVQSVLDPLNETQAVNGKAVADYFVEDVVAPKVISTVITGSAYNVNGTILSNANYQRTAKIPVSPDKNYWAKVGSSQTGLACLFYDVNDVIVYRIYSTNNEFQKLDIPTGVTSIALSGTIEFDLILEVRSSDLVKDTVDQIDVYGITQKQIPFYRGSSIVFDTGLEAYSQNVQATRFIDVNNGVIKATGIFIGSNGVFFYDANKNFISKTSNPFGNNLVTNFVFDMPEGTRFVRFSSVFNLTYSVTQVGVWNQLIDSIPSIVQKNEEQTSQITTSLSSPYYNYGQNFTKIRSEITASNFGILFFGQSNALDYGDFSELSTYSLPSTLPINNYNAGTKTYDNSITIANTTRSWGLYWSILSRLYNFSVKDYYLLKYAISASSLNISWNPKLSLTGNNNLVTALGRVKDSRALNIPVNTKCIIWVQGESDGNTEENANRYYQSLKNLIEMFRGSLEKPSVKFICVGVHPDNNLYGPFGDTVRQAMIDACNEVEYATFIDPINLPFTSVDGIHYDAAYYEELAPLIFDEIKDL